VAFSSAARSRAAILRGVGSVLDVGGTGVRSRRGDHATASDAWKRVGQSFRAAVRNTTGAPDDPEELLDEARSAALARLTEIQLGLLQNRWAEFTHSDEHIDDRHYPFEPFVRFPPYYPFDPFMGRLLTFEEFHYSIIQDRDYWPWRYYPELELYLIEAIAHYSRQQEPPVRFIAYLVQLLNFVRFEKKVASCLR
jgi:hypothetical protein